MTGTGFTGVLDESMSVRRVLKVEIMGESPQFGQFGTAVR